MKKHLVIWRTKKNDPIMDGFSHKPEYHMFFQKCSEVFELRFANQFDSYIGGGNFQNVLKYEKGRLIPAESEFKADVIYQMTRIPPDKFDNAVKMIDSVEFRNWCVDKWNQYQFFADFMPQTFLISNQIELNSALQTITTAKAILKPRYGKQGRGIFILDTNALNQLNPAIFEDTDYILQEFSDTNIEVPKIVNGRHDIKLITMGDKVFANLRTPLTGSEICKYDSPYSEIPLANLSSEMLAFHKVIKNKIDAKFPGQIYSIDIGISKNGPLLFEVNGYTAFPFIHFTYADEFFETLIGKLAS